MAAATDQHGHTHGSATAPTLTARRSDTARAAARPRTRVLHPATSGWTTGAGAVAALAGLAAGSVSLVGFGAGSAIEVSAALILAWRLRQEGRDGCMQDV